MNVREGMLHNVLCVERPCSFVRAVELSLKLAGLESYIATTRRSTHIADVDRRRAFRIE